MTYPIIQQASLPPNTIVPENDSLFIPYLNRLYEDIALTVNDKDNIYFTAPITSSATDIPNLPNYGAYIICVSGENSTLPTITASLCKSTTGSAGSIASLGSQAGSGAWAGINLTITSTATNFQIAHNNTGVTGNFNIRILGTQGDT
jgi:hypothetical protein